MINIIYYSTPLHKTHDIILNLSEEAEMNLFLFPFLKKHKRHLIFFFSERTFSVSYKDP